MPDNFVNFTPGLESPASRQFLIVPSDTVDLPFTPRAIVCLTSGNVVILDKFGTQVAYPVTAGDRLTFRAQRIMATGNQAAAAGVQSTVNVQTTATLIGWE